MTIINLIGVSMEEPKITPIAPDYSFIKRSYAPEDRIIAFFDILGWAHATTNPDWGNLSTAIELLHIERGIWNQENRNREEPPGTRRLPHFDKIKVSVFSDNVAISKPSEWGGRIFSVSDIIVRMLSHGWLLRGAICRGMLAHEDHVVFGPSLVKAVRIEQSTSMPRIVCDESIDGVMGDHDRSRMVIDSEGVRVLNPFYRSLTLTSGESDWGMLVVWNDLNKIKGHIETRVADSHLDGNARLKWVYMKDNMSLFLDSAFGDGFFEEVYANISWK